MRILGIDPGLHITGYALLTLHSRGPALEEAGVLRIGAKDPLPDRLHQLHRQISELLADFPCNHMAVEQLYAHYKHPRTAILMGHARGVILLAAAQADIQLTSLPSTLVKKKCSPATATPPNGKFNWPSPPCAILPNRLRPLMSPTPLPSPGP